MTRISTLAQNQVVVTRMLQSQQKIAETQRQIGSGTVADRFKGIAQDTSALLGAKAVETRTAKFVALGQQVVGRLEQQDTSLATLYESAKKLREDLLGALATDSGRTISADIGNGFDIAKSVLNTRVAGNYIFSGGRTNVPPFNASTVADLAVVGNPITSYFDNFNAKAQVRIDQNLTVEYGLLADDIGQSLMASIKTLAEYDSATPFSTNLTAADEAIVQTEIANLQLVMDSITQTQALNGLTQRRVEDVIVRHEQLDVVNKNLIAGIEQVDIAEAISRLNREQLAVEAAYSLVRELNELSLLNFI